MKNFNKEELLKQEFFVYDISNMTYNKYHVHSVSDIVSKKDDFHDDFVIVILDKIFLTFKWTMKDMQDGVKMFPKDGKIYIVKTNDDNNEYFLKLLDDIKKSLEKELMFINDIYIDKLNTAEFSSVASNKTWVHMD